jgi:hypothetical protein
MEISEFARKRIIPYSFAVSTQLIIQVWIVMMLIVGISDIHPTAFYWDLHAILFLAGMFMSFLTFIIPIGFLNELVVEELWAISLSGVVGTFVAVFLTYLSATCLC